MSSRVEIVFCPRCKWLPRATWMAQELLSTFEAELGELTLKPGPAGTFDVLTDGELVWSRKAEGRFPDIAELKRLVRDRVAPGRRLGHVDAGDEPEA